MLNEVVRDTDSDITLKSIAIPIAILKKISAILAIAILYCNINNPAFILLSKLTVGRVNPLVGSGRIRSGQVGSNCINPLR